jgi:DNA-binding transcriptional LysR family regulator
MRHLKLYRAIRLIRREGSIRRAAEKLAISPSALNRAILGFEDEMQMAVFERVPGGVQLTAAGELLVDLVERHLREFENLRDTLDELQAGLRGTLRLSIGSDIAAGRLMEAVARFEREHPRICTEIVQEDGTGPLLRREVDLAFLTNPVTDNRLEVVYAHTVPIAVWSRLPFAENDGLWRVLEGRVMLPPKETGTHVAIAHRLRRQRLAMPPSCTAMAFQMPHRARPDIQAYIFPECVMPPPEAPAGLHRLPIRIGDVQVTALRLARVPASRAAIALVKAVNLELETGGGLEAVAE